MYKGFEKYYPSWISGGMQKRTGLARAMALDPKILMLDEPSAGLDPISSGLIDDLILELRDNLGATIVVATHELASIFRIADNCVFLYAESATMIAHGDPKELSGSFTRLQGPAVFERRRRENTMKTRISPTLIGMFVIGALAILVAAVVGLGSGKWFRKTYEFVLYFQGSVKPFFVRR
jgi:ABC-type multidrug transport system ATPase subunit